MTELPSANLRIAIVGTGAIGGLVAMHCQHAGLTYTMLLRPNAPQHSITIEGLDGQCIPLSGKQCDLYHSADWDLVILPIKAYQVTNALKSLQGRLSPHTIIVLLHNGMGSIEIAKELLPNTPCIAGTTSCGAYKPQPNLVKQTGNGETHFGWVNNKPSHHVKIEQLLSKTIPNSTWHIDITLALWNKLSINAVINPLTAIHNIQNGQLADSSFKDIIEHINNETYMVMTALGYQVTKQALLQSVYKVIASTANNYSSMHQDIFFKRVTEIDAINGYIVKKAQQLNIAVPYHQDLVNQVASLSTIEPTNHSNGHMPLSSAAKQSLM